MGSQLWLINDRLPKAAAPISFCIMKMKQNGGDNDFDDVDDYNYLTNIYFDLDAVFDTSRRHLQLIEGVRVAR